MQLTPSMELDERLSRIDGLVGLLSFLQDASSSEERARNANAEGYLVQVIMEDSRAARRCFNQLWADRAANKEVAA